MDGKNMFSKISKLIKNDSTKRFVGIIVIKDEDNLLVGNRADNNMVVFPGGHVQEDETFFDAAIRECKEETGIEPETVEELFHNIYEDEEGNCKHIKVYYTKNFKGKVDNTDELSNVKFSKINHLPINDMADYSQEALIKMIKRILGREEYKEILDKIEECKKKEPEELTKNLTLSYCDAINIVGTKTYKFLENEIVSVEINIPKDIIVGDDLLLRVRKHEDNKYSGSIVQATISSGAINEGKQLLSFTNLTLLDITIAVLTITDWRVPKGLTRTEVNNMFSGEKLSHIMNPHFSEEEVAQFPNNIIPPDEYINKGIKMLMNQYRKDQLKEINEQMSMIKESLRNDSAVDLRAIEIRLMKLLDRLDNTVRESEKKIHEIDVDVKTNFDILEGKILELRNKISELDRKPVKAKLAKSISNPEAILQKDYFYLSTPKLIKNSDKTIDLEFNSDWDYPNIKAYLTDIKGKILSLKREVD